MKEFAWGWKCTKLLSAFGVEPRVYCDQKVQKTPAAPGPVATPQAPAAPGRNLESPIDRASRLALDFAAQVFHGTGKWQEAMNLARHARETFLLGSDEDDSEPGIPEAWQ